MTIKLKIGDKNAYVNGEQKTLDVIPFTKNGRTLVPLRFIAEAFGFEVAWDDKTKEITITDGIISKHKSRFKTVDECAIDFAMCYNALSIGLEREISAVITEDKDGYYYTNVYIGTEDANVIQKKGVKYVSDIHTHGSAGGYKAFDKFSSSDIKSTIKRGADSYLVSPYGNVQKYMVKEGKSIIVSKDVPFDVDQYEKIAKVYPDVKNNIKYFKRYFGTLPNVDIEDNKYTTQYLTWCNKADEYNKLFWSATI